MTQELVVHQPNAADYIGRPMPIARRSPVLRVVIFSAVAIRDTGNHPPRDLVPTIGAKSWGFDVYNGHNQIVTLTVLGGGGADPANLPPILGVATQTVAANARGALVLDVTTTKAPYVSVRASYSAAPTAGDLTIVGWAEGCHDA